ncbi:hypothetical protein N7507_011589 [Penicillium longicatenatum]|nr:hypothetical protein N7507_011589 [Penicillium longicatenatum]
MTTISSSLNDCLKELGEFASSRVQRYENDVSQPRWLDELGRLRIWAGNTGALQRDQLSLDYRLRDASHLRNEITNILQRVLRVVRSLSDFLDEPEENTSEDEAFLDLAGEVSDEDLMTDAQMLHQSLHNSISLLNQLSLETRKPAEHDLLLGVNVEDITPFGSWAQQHVSRIFPDLDESTVQRLSAAMAKQKAVLQYRSQKPRPSGQIVDSESTLPRRAPTESSQAGGGLNQLQFSETSTSELPQAPYFINAFTGYEPASIPSPPESSTDSSPFECPYCGSFMTIKCPMDWANHIFEDLMPYTCLSSDCITPFKLYESRSQWYRHMCEAHSILSKNDVFRCPLCHLCLDFFEPPVTFEQHVGEHLEQLALFVLRTVSEHSSPDAASHPLFLEISNDSTLPVDEMGTQESSNDRLAVETTNVGLTAKRSLEAARQSDGPFDCSFEVPMAHSEEMNHPQLPGLSADSDICLSLSPAENEMSEELQDEANTLSPVESLSQMELDSPVDFDRGLDCTPVPSSTQKFDRQAAFDRFFPELFPQMSTESDTRPRETPQTSQASPICEEGQNSIQDSSEDQSPISDDFNFDWKLYHKGKDPVGSDEAQMRTTAFLQTDLRADLPGKKISTPEKIKPTKLMASVLPTYHDFTSDDLNEESDEYIQTKFDHVGETKVDFLGYLRHNREYKCQTFRLPYRGKKLFMLSEECAEALNYYSRRRLFMKYRSLHEMAASSVEKETMMEKHILPVEDQHMMVTFVSARSIFLQFGCRIIVNGRQFRDDYWESRAREDGYTEANISNEQQPGDAEPKTGVAVSKEEVRPKRRFLPGNRVSISN